MKKILPTIVIAQFLCTSLWFAGNAVIANIAALYPVNASFLANMTSAVQFGFIIGTLSFALFSIADRFSPSKVFFICATLAAATNLAICLPALSIDLLVGFRFATGFFLAGIYPVGMKIAADYYQKGLGKSLGFLVGALIVGTAFPHYLKSINGLPWKEVMMTTSALAFAGGLALWLLVPDGPYRKAGQKIQFHLMLTAFKNKKFRSAAFGYFGHMWELYAFWVFVPIILTAYQNQHPQSQLNVPLLSFIIIGVGSIACVFSGFASEVYGAKRVASFALIISCCCCLIAPFIFMLHSASLLIGFLLIWSLAVVADSPLLSTLVAKNTEESSRGTSITLVTCIGFSITIISIQLLSFLNRNYDTTFIYWLLAIGPILGIIALFQNKVDENIKPQKAQ